MPKTVCEITAEYLKANGYDGLYNPLLDCACRLGDLMPCDGDVAACLPGYLQKCLGGDDCPVGGDCDWHIGEEKEK